MSTKRTQEGGWSWPGTKLPQCRRCGGVIPTGRRRTFCSAECVHEWKLRTNPQYLRSEVYKRDREDLKGMADLIIAKQRNGPIGTVPLRFLGQYTRFENRMEDLPEQPGE